MLPTSDVSLYARMNLPHCTIYLNGYVQTVSKTKREMIL